MKKVLLIFILSLSFCFADGPIDSETGRDIYYTQGYDKDYEKCMDKSLDDKARSYSCYMVGGYYAKMSSHELSFKYIDMSCDLKSEVSCWVLSEMHFVLSQSKDKKQVTKSIEYIKKACDIKPDSEYCEYYNTIKTGKVSDEISKMLVNCDKNRNASACLDVSKFYYKIRDHKSYHDYLKKSCEFGSGDSCNDFSLLYAGGHWVDKDMSKYLFYQQIACNLGHKESCANIIDAISKYYDGFIKECNVNKDGVYCGALGIYYFVKQDKEKIIEFLKKGCDLDDYFSCIILGNYYLYEFKDPKSAFGYLDKSCGTYDDKIIEYAACFSLAGVYYFSTNIPEGISTEKRYEKAIQYLKMGCGVDNKEACKFLADVELEAQKLSDLKADAEKLNKKNKEKYNFDENLNKCHNKKNGSGCYEVAIYYLSSDDIEKTIEYMIKSCEYGNGTACANVAELYNQGLGLPKDQNKAKVYNKKACDNGFISNCK